MKKIIILIIATSVSVFGADGSGDNKSSWSPSVEMTSSIYSKYLDESGAIYYDDPAIQSDLTVSFENGAYLYLWNSTPVDFSEWGDNFGTEQDISLGWSGSLSTVGVGGWVGDCEVDISAIFWDEPRLGTFGADDVFNLVFEIAREFPYGQSGSNTIRISLAVEYAWLMPGSSYEGGLLSMLGVGTSRQLLSERLTADLSVCVVHDSGRFGGDNGFVLGGQAGLEWHLTEKISLLLPRVLWTTPISVDDERRLSASVSAGVKLSF